MSHYNQMLKSDILFFSFVLIFRPWTATALAFVAFVVVVVVFCLFVCSQEK